VCAVQITELDSTKLLAAAGENSDRVALTEYLKANLALHKYRSRLDLSTHAAASWIRSTVRGRDAQLDLPSLPSHLLFPLLCPRACP
jgi:20S proteasome alpha/beta subunit